MQLCAISRIDIHAILDQVTDFLFPQVCMICGKVLSERNAGPYLMKRQLCVRCLSAFPVRLQNDRWFHCLSDPYETDPIPDFSVWALFHYEMPVTGLLRRLKFQSASYCGQLLGDLIAREFPKDLDVTFTCVVPIPLSEKRLAERGFNQSSILGEELSRALSVPLLEDVLVRNRHTNRQSRFHDPLLREGNVSGAFSVAENWDISGWNVLLLDDILTSGATLHEAARILYAAGANLVIGAVAATHRENQ